MNYMNEEYNSRIGPMDRIDVARGPMNRLSTSWSSMNSGSGEGMTRSLMDRDVMTQGPRDNEGMVFGRTDDVRRGQFDRSGLTLEHRQRENVARGPGQLDSLAGLRMDREDIRRGHVGRDDRPHGLLDRDGIRVHLDGGSVPWSRLDREDKLQSGIDRDNILRARDGIFQARLDRDNLPRASVDWDLLCRAILDRGGTARGSTDQDVFLTVGKTKDQMVKDYATRETASGSVMKGKPQSCEGRDNGAQSDMETTDMEMSDMEMSDMELSDIEPSEIKQGNVDQSEATKGEVLIANSADPKKEETAKGDGPEDGKEKYYCEICQLQCLSSISYISHTRGQKHMKATRAAENGGSSAITKSKKIKNLKDYMNEPVREPLIGLEYVREFRRPGKVEPSYHCELCDSKVDAATMILHLSGFRHRKAYISKAFPFLLKVPARQNEDKIQFFRRMAADIERDEGLKTYKVDAPTEKDELKSLLENKPGENKVRKSRWDNEVQNNEALKAKALLYLETYEIDSDNEAVLVMILTQYLSDKLKTYCLKVTEETEQSEKVARARRVAEALSQTNSVIQPGPHTLGAGSFPSGGGNWNLLPNQPALNQPMRFPAGGPNWHRDAMQNEPLFGRGNWNRAPMMPNALRPAALHLPRAFAPEMTANKGPLPPDILNLIRGTDVRYASVILTSLADSHPALQRVNIANLLNMLVITGVIK